jgi:N-acetylmuramoyl-L-alanine amidase
LPLTIVYPSEGADIPAVSKSFLFGATAPGAAVSVNGAPASVAADGGWIAYVPFAPGRFVLHVTASLRGVVTESDLTVLVGASGIWAFPSETTVVEPGDALALAVQASAGDRVTASGPGFTGIALSPDPRLGDGAFSASIPAPDTAGSAAPVEYRIASADGATKLVASLATLRVEPAQRRIGEVVTYSPDPESGTRLYGMLAPGPGAATAFTVPAGTPFQYGRSRGHYVAVELEPGLPLMWIDEHQIAPDPSAKIPPVVPAETSVARGAREDAYTLRLPGRMPFRVDEDVARGELKLTFFAGGHHSGEVDLAGLARPLWGYTCEWSGDDLVITVRRPPPFAPAPAPALRGLLIVIDPGHSPDSGAVGPLGTLERDVNLDIALRLRSKLQALGARVVMTRDTDAGVALYDRPALAERLGADALISVHNNAWPDGVDPATHHGFTIYYFQPHSLALADAMHAAYARDTDLPDQGVQSGDLALVRSSALPSVLTESAFIAWPLEEMRLREPAFRDRLAFTMADGLERWAASMREIENGRP